MEGLFSGWKWEPPATWPVIRTIDMHTAGEPLRIITSGLPPIPGDTILEKSAFFRDHYDDLRKGLIWEPRGHADMYGAVLTPPVQPDGDFGVFFIHNDGYSTMCGHAIIALTTLVLETGIIKTGRANRPLMIDAPSGRIVSRAEIKNGRVEKVKFENVPSFVLHSNKYLDVEGIGKIKIDIAFGGAFYTFTDADRLGISLDSKDYSSIIDIGRKIKKATNEQFEIIHPGNPGLSFLYGTIFTGKAQNQANHSRNVCVFADGEVDRSPTGTGVSARAAIHYQKGELNPGVTITIESILGTTMGVRIKESIDFFRFNAVIPEVSGNAFITGRNEFYFDPGDPLKNGFIFR